MSIVRIRPSFLLVVMLLSSSLLLSCGEADPTATTQPVVPATPTTAALTSPLAEPTATITIVLPELQASPVPKDTPDPARTPVAITQAELLPDREVVTIQNISNQDQDISGWVLFNLESDHVFRFPEDIVLKPGDSVQVFSAVAEEDVPEGGYFWTQDKVWNKFPANVMLLNKATRLMYWYVAYGEN